MFEDIYKSFESTFGSANINEEFCCLSGYYHVSMCSSLIIIQCEDCFNEFEFEILKGDCSEHELRIVTNWWGFKIICLNCNLEVDQILN